MLSLRAITGFHIVRLLIYMIIYNVPDATPLLIDQYTEQCKYETETLCPDCFPEPVNCNFFAENITFEGFEWYNSIVDPFNRYDTRVGSLNGGKKLVIIKNINRDGAIQKIRDSICQELNIDASNCTLSSNEIFLEKLRQQRLAEDRAEDPQQGVTFCPPGDKRSLKRFVDKFNQPELTTLLLMSTNIQPLMIQLFALQNQPVPVPSFVFQGGFILVETYEGEPLTIFAKDSLKLRLKIAYHLINAFLKFDAGVSQFRFYLTDQNLHNFVVNDVEKPKVSFAGLRDLIIRDSLTLLHDPNKTDIIHSRINCDICFSYLHEEVCLYRYTDTNLFVVCQLLYEPNFWNTQKGFLHNTESGSEYIKLNELLRHCVHCKPPSCEQRVNVLKQIKDMIFEILT